MTATNAISRAVTSGGKFAMAWFLSVAGRKDVTVRRMFKVRGILCGVDEDLEIYEERLRGRLEEQTLGSEERFEVLQALAEAEGEALSGDGALRP